MITQPGEPSSPIALATLGDISIATLSADGGE
jgi:hypothetical protein